MRLTLRTLLAYLDRVLPADQLADLKSRVESNENASKIIERLQEVLTESRLSALKIDGKGFDGDPNIVAAYLDGSLPSEHIADFEKLCLESDRHWRKWQASTGFWPTSSSWSETQAFARPVGNRRGNGRVRNAGTARQYDRGPNEDLTALAIAPAAKAPVA